MKIFLAFLLFSLFLAPLFAQKSNASNATFDYRTKFKTAEELKGETDKSKRIFGLMTGHYSNQAQAQALDNPLYREQNLVIVPIWEEKRRGENWFYLGWFASGRLEQSLGEIIFRVERHSRDSFLATYYLIKENYPLEWQKQDAFGFLSPQELELGQGCLAYLTEVEVGKVIWEASDFCKHTVSDQIAHHRIKFVIEAPALKSFTHFYDTNKALIFGYPEDLPSIFDRPKDKISKSSRRKRGK